MHETEQVDTSSETNTKQFVFTLKQQAKLNIKHFIDFLVLVYFIF